MGYFDDFDDRPRVKRSKAGLYGVVGGIIGGLLVAFILPLFTNTNQPVERDQKQGIYDQQEVNNNTNAYTQVATRAVSTDVSDVVERVQNSIVGVVNLQGGLSDFWDRSDSAFEAGTGSGVIFEKRDDIVYIVTNYHVIEDATDVEVVLANGERVKAEVKGTDPLTDLAVLSILATGNDAQPLPLGDSDKLKSGEPAIAIGNPLGLDFSRTVTLGIISSTQRSIPQDVDGDGAVDWEMDVIQTDAAINPGNSGGALLNINGQLIGINSAKISDIGIEGMGFAIPINDARPLIYELLERGTIRRPYIGLTPKDLQEVDSYHWENSLTLPKDVTTGVVVIEVAPRGPASLAGLLELDVIVEMDGQPIQSAADLRGYLYKNKSVGDTVEVTFYRDGRLQTTTVQLGEMDLP